MAEPYIWDTSSRRYRAPSGRYVSDSGLIDELDTYIASKSDRLAALTQQLQSGSIDMAEWQDQVLREIKSAHVNASTLAHGGREQMSQADWGRVGRLLRDQYEFARNWAQDIAGGTAPIDGRMVARSRLYANAIRGTFENIRARDQRNAGVRFERNVLHASESCSGCLAESRRGWVEIGTLVPIGARHPCRVNCRCTISYSNTKGQAQAA